MMREKAKGHGEEEQERAMGSALFTFLVAAAKYLASNS